MLPSIGVSVLPSGVSGGLTSPQPADATTTSTHPQTSFAISGTGKFAENVTAAAPGGRWNSPTCHPQPKKAEEFRASHAGSCALLSLLIVLGAGGGDDGRLTRFMAG